MKEQSLPQEADLIPPLESHQVSRNGWIESVALLFDLWFTFYKLHIILIKAFIGPHTKRYVTPLLYT